MCERESTFCPECRDPMSLVLPAMKPQSRVAIAAGAPPDAPDRRQFMRVMGGGAAAMMALGGGVLRPARADEKAASKPQPRKPKPAEDLIRELHATLTDEQKKTLVLDWDHSAAKGRIPTRLGMYNSPLNGQRIGDAYTPAQQELQQRILKSVLNGDDGFNRISRGNTWDNSKSFTGCGAHIFGDPSGDGKFAWLFTGHHLTVRCDGNSMPGAAFGGPIYYGHLKHGYSKGNAYNFQTQSVQKVYDALDGKQREKAAREGSPGEQAKSVVINPDADARPGIAYAELSGDQQKLVAQVMRDLLEPFRPEDGDEVMAIIKATGGMDKLHLAFFKDETGDPDEPWHFWRIEGPGFVWNYRILPHVHCFVNIASQVA